MTPPSLSEFTAAAREYCLLAEQDEPLGNAGLWKIRDLLLRLMYHISSADEAPQDPTEDDPEKTTAELHLRVITQFGTLGITPYRTISNPFDLEANDSLGMGVLSDDLADIYLDLAKGLARANRSQMQHACHEWSSSYRTHWGQHATHALMAIESHRITNRILPRKNADDGLPI